MIGKGRYSRYDLVLTCPACNQPTVSITAGYHPEEKEQDLELIVMRKSTYLAILLFISLMLAACRSETPTPSPTATETAAPVLAASPTPSPSHTPAPPTATVPTPTQTLTPTPEILAYGPDNFPSDVNPLTGLKVADPSLLDRRPLAVKVQLFPRGQRPPYGVSAADLVFDFYQNTGLTRLHAIFYGQDAGRVSPIRSARIFDGELVEMYKSIFAFGGADRRIFRQFDDKLNPFLILEGAPNSTPLERIEPNILNYLTVDTAELSQYASDNGINNTRQNLDGMSFDPLEPTDGDPGVKLFVRYSISAYVRWDYDETNDVYIRYQDTREAGNQAEEDYGVEPIMSGFDDKPNEPITAVNVLVLKVSHVDRDPWDNAEIIEIDLEGSGDGYAFRNGKMYAITWHRSTDDPDKLLTFTLKEDDGSLFKFMPGNTWFQIIGGSSSDPEAVGDGVLRFVSINP